MAQRETLIAHSSPPGGEPGCRPASQLSALARSADLPTLGVQQKEGRWEAFVASTREHRELCCATSEYGCSSALRLRSVLAMCAKLRAVLHRTFARTVPEEGVHVGAGLRGASGAAFAPEFRVRVNVL